MTEAFKDDYYVSEECETTQLEPPIASLPPLEEVRELMPSFVVTKDDRDWWRGLPLWRKELYLLPKADTEATRIRQINALGMGVVKYVAGQEPVVFSPYPKP